MRQTLLIFLFAFAVPSVFSANQQKYNTSKYANFDVDAVLNNERILRSYVKCLTGDGPCTKEGRELSQILPEAIKTECSRCNEKQKTTSIKVFRVLNDKYPEMLDKLMRKFDPTGEYAKKFKDRILKPRESATSPAQ